MLDSSTSAWVIYTLSMSEQERKRIQDSIMAPQQDGGLIFYAHVLFIQDRSYLGLTPLEVVHLLPNDYPYDFCFIVDHQTAEHRETPILVVGFEPQDDLDETQTSQLYPSGIKTFYAIPNTIQSIENNLSIANMDFVDFAYSADNDGIFRQFPS